MQAFAVAICNNFIQTILSHSLANSTTVPVCGEYSVFVDFAQKQFEHKSFQRQTRLADTHTHTHSSCTSFPSPHIAVNVYGRNTLWQQLEEESQYERRLQPRKLTARFTRSNSEQQRQHRRAANWLRLRLRQRPRRR